MAGTEKGAEKVYGSAGGKSLGEPGNRGQLIQTDGRGFQKTQPEVPTAIRLFLDGGNGLYTVAITNANQVFELPQPGDEYTFIANGNTAFVLCGGLGVVATTAVGGYDFPIADAIYWRCRPQFTHVGFLGNATAGAITIIHHRRP